LGRYREGGALKKAQPSNNPAANSRKEDSMGKKGMDKEEHSF